MLKHGQLVYLLPGGPPMWVDRVLPDGVVACLWPHEVYGGGYALAEVVCSADSLGAW